MGITTRMFYYWKKRVREAEGNCGQRGAARESSGPAAVPARDVAASFVPVSIQDAGPAGQLEIALANACVVRLVGDVDPKLLRVAIRAAGQLDSPRQGGP
jgi:hypothetical protein